MYVRFSMSPDYLVSIEKLIARDQSRPRHKVSAQ